MFQSKPRIPNWFNKLTSPHFYYGRSSGLLLLHNVLRAAQTLLEPRYKNFDMKKLKALKNSRIGKSALVLGNGPSLDLLKYENIDTSKTDVFVVNEFYLSQISTKVRPNFYVLSDNASFSDSETGSLFSMTGLTEYLRVNQCALLLPHTVNHELFKPIKEKIYFNDKNGPWLSKNINPTRPRGYVSVTLYKALALALYFGYDRVYILGLDNTEFHAYSGNEKNEIIHSRNSYAKETMSENKDDGRTMKEFTSGIAGRMNSYAHLFGDLQKFNKGNVINLYRKSLVDAFSKKSDSNLV